MRQTWGRALGAAMLLAIPAAATAQTPEIDAAHLKYLQLRQAWLLTERTRNDAELARLLAAGSPAAPAAAAVPDKPAATAAELAAERALAAQTAADQAQEARLQKKPATEAQAAAAAAPSGKQPFGGLEFGIGLSATFDLGRENRNDRASLVAGLVRVDDRNNNVARIMLESHYFFLPCGRLFSLYNSCENGSSAEPKNPRWGVGPFVAIRPGKDDVIDAIGAGLMLGLHRGQTGQSFNIGVGLAIDPNTRVLGKGVFENQPLPAGETEVRFRETTQLGILALTSFSF